MELVLGLRVRVLHRDLRADFVERRHTSRTERIPRGHETEPPHRVMFRFRSRRRSRLGGPRRSLARIHLGRQNRKGCGRSESDSAALALTRTLRFDARSSSRLCFISLLSPARHPFARQRCHSDVIRPGLGSGTPRRCGGAGRTPGGRLTVCEPLRRQDRVPPPGAPRWFGETGEAPGTVALTRPRYPGKSHVVPRDRLVSHEIY
jgi:hypothetical protein